MNGDNSKVCRLCLKLLYEEKHFDINYTERLTGFMPFRDQLTTCMPELALDILPECYICQDCADALKASYDFKKSCLKIEDKIKKHFSNMSSDSKWSLMSLAEDTKEPDKASLLRAQLELHVVPSENNLISIPKTKIKKTVKSERNQTHFCKTCELTFKTGRELHTHHKTVHYAPLFLCNFCSGKFPTLFLLRQHNTLCTKRTERLPSNVTTMKRPQLPANAKNHLTQWLFHHQRHPYPTEHEKQMLMKETNLTLIQVENWFINARRRILLNYPVKKRLRTTTKPVKPQNCQ